LLHLAPLCTSGAGETRHFKFSALVIMANCSQPTTCCPQMGRGQGYVALQILAERWYLENGTR